jgi:hypothetical protein
MAGLAPGIEEENSLQQAGFSPSEIDSWKADTRGQLEGAGFNGQEVDDYFGVKTPDLAKTEQNFKTNLAAKQAAAPAPKESAVQEPLNPHPEMKQADSFIEAIEAGFDMSVTGLMKGRPDMMLPEHAPMFYRIASQVAQLAGDVPAMIAGGVAGGAAGAAAGTATVPLLGTVALGAVGAGAGAFALPEGIRTALMEHYEKGDIHSFGDFWERASAVAINSLKAGAIGGVTAGVGGAVAKVGAKVAAPAIVKTTAQLTAEVATMTTLGAAMEGKVPEPQDFIDAAILVGGLHGATHAAGKLRAMYGKGGVPPADIVEKTITDPKLKQEILSDNVPAPGRGEFGISVEKPELPETIPTTKPLKEPNPDHSEAVNTIRSKIGDPTDAPKKSMTASQIYTALVDKLDPINEATKTLKAGLEELPADKNPYILARTSVDSASKAKHFFENGTIDFKTGDVNGESMRSILKSVESPDILEAYMVSKRAIEKNGQGLHTGFDIPAAEKVVAEHGAKYEDAARRMTEFSNRTLDYMEGSGVISGEQKARMIEANKDYVPFKRIFDPEEKAAGKGRSGKGASLKEFKGSDRSIQSPILSAVENTVELLKIAETNRPKKALIELAAKTPDQELIKRVPDKMQAIEVSASEIIQALERQGTPTLESIRKDLKAQGLPLTDEQVLKAFESEKGNVLQTEHIKDIVVFRKKNMDLAPNQFAVFEAGKRKIYETTPELADAIKRLDGDTTATNILFKIANGITTVKKFGITFTPDFIVRNLFRDALTANTFSQSKGISPVDILAAMGDIWKKNDTYYEWLRSGGSNGAFLDLGDRYIKNDIYKLQRETNFMNSVRNLVEKPIEMMRVGAELSEQSLRVAEYKKVRKAGGSMVEGGYASREITIDFQRIGAKMSALNSITAFMNVQVQGLDRTARAFKENPTSMATKSMAYITVPSVLLWWANHDDPRYQEIPRWEKDLFWIIPTDKWTDAGPEEADGLPEYMVRQKGDKFQINKGTIYRLPKPQELGLVFGTLPERTLEAFFGENPGAYKDFQKTVTGLITPSFVPDAVAPAIEQYFNKSFFTGRDIVPHHLKGILPEYQFVEYTSETAKTLGKMVATMDRQSDFASPMVLDNYIRSWGGSLGQYAVQTADKALVKAGIGEDVVKPTATLSDLPMIKSFVVRFPQAGSNSVQDFQDNYTSNKQIVDTVRHLAKEGDYKNMERELLLNSNQDKLVRLDGIQEALSNQSKFIRLIQKNPDMSPDEKRQMIDGMYMTMTESAKVGNQLMTEIRKQLGE